MIARVDRTITLRDRVFATVALITCSVSYYTLQLLGLQSGAVLRALRSAVLICIYFLAPLWSSMSGAREIYAYTDRVQSSILLSMLGEAYVSYGEDFGFVWHAMARCLLVLALFSSPYPVRPQRSVAFAVPFLSGYAFALYVLLPHASLWYSKAAVCLFGIVLCACGTLACSRIGFRHVVHILSPEVVATLGTLCILASDVMQGYARLVTAFASDHLIYVSTFWLGQGLLAFSTFQSLHGVADREVMYYTAGRYASMGTSDTLSPRKVDGPVGMSINTEGDDAPQQRPMPKEGLRHKIGSPAVLTAGRYRSDTVDHQQSEEAVHASVLRQQIQERDRELSALRQEVARLRGPVDARRGLSSL